MITVRSGRFGPYVTDGETNASLRTGEDADAITLERAVELLSARRERVASGEVAAPKKRPAARKTAKKATTKKTAKKA
jgi:DNA topoisomerase-1